MKMSKEYLEDLYNTDRYLYDLLTRKINRFSDFLTGNIHTQNEDEDQQGSFKNNALDNLFRKEKPIREAYKDWLEAKGVKQAINETHDNKEFIKDVKGVIKWFEGDCRKPIEVYMLLDAPDYDFLDCGTLRLLVSERVLVYLEKHHKGEYEFFPVVDANKRVTQTYYAVNINHRNFEFEFKGDFKGLDYNLPSRYFEFKTLNYGS